MQVIDALESNIQLRDQAITPAKHCSLYEPQSIKGLIPLSISSRQGLGAGVVDIPLGCFVVLDIHGMFGREPQAIEGFEDTIRSPEKLQ
jgi:hypothetical protein